MADASVHGFGWVWLVVGITAIAALLIVAGVALGLAIAERRAAGSHGSTSE